MIHFTDYPKNDCNIHYGAAKTMRTLIGAHAHVIAMLPERKQKSSYAKANNLFRRIIADFAPIIKNDMLNLSQFEILKEVPTLPLKNIGDENLSLQQPQNTNLAQMIDNDIILSQEEVIALAVDSWRLMFAHEHAIDLIPQDSQHEEKDKASDLFVYSFTYLLKQLKCYNLKIVHFEGKIYEANRPVHAINAEDFADDEPLLVSKTLEPALVEAKSGRVLYFAKVLLTPAGNTNIEKE